ncbi:MAG: DMT family transporter [Actinomycetes bacterium]
MEILAAATGVLIAIQARSNGQLAKEIHNPIEAALVSFSSGLIAVVVIALFNSNIRRGLSTLRRAVKLHELPLWPLFAGAIGGVVIAIQTSVVSAIGVAIYSVASISGQTAVSLFIDRIGLVNGVKQHISPRRVLAAITTILAVFLSVGDKVSVTHFALLAVVMTVIAGSLIGIQRALNGKINHHSKQSFATSLLNFITGTSALVVTLVAMIIIRGDHLYALPKGPWWLYLGGITGVIYIAFASTVVQHLGVLTFTLFSVGGQLLGSLLIDIFLPSQGSHVTWFLVSGIVLTYVGVLIGGQSRLFRR